MISIKLSLLPQSLFLAHLWLDTKTRSNSSSYRSSWIPGQLQQDVLKKLALSPFPQGPRSPGSPALTSEELQILTAASACWFISLEVFHTKSSMQLLTSENINSFCLWPPFFSSDGELEIWVELWCQLFEHFTSWCVWSSIRKGQTCCMRQQRPGRDKCEHAFTELRRFPS